MNKSRALVAVCALALVACLTWWSSTRAAEEEVRGFDRSLVRINTGEADIDISAANYTTGFNNMLTIEPDDNHAMYDVRVVLDLDKTTNGFNDAGGGMGNTTFLVERKVDGTNWRADIANVTTGEEILAPNMAAGRSLEFDLGTVTPTEDARISVQTGTEVADIEIPYMVYYRSGASATFTPVAAQ